MNYSKIFLALKEVSKKVPWNKILVYSPSLLAAGRDLYSQLRNKKAQNVEPFSETEKINTLSDVNRNLSELSSKINAINASQTKDFELLTKISYHVDELTSQFKAIAFRVILAVLISLLALVIALISFIITLGKT